MEILPLSLRHRRLRQPSVKCISCDAELFARSGFVLFACHSRIKLNHFEALPWFLLTFVEDDRTLNSYVLAKIQLGIQVYLWLRALFDTHDLLR
jgi:hypothetical protein